MQRSHGSQRGFSLVELLVVVAIMLVVAAAAMPNFISFISTYKLRSVLQQTNGMLQQMRMEAVRRNTSIPLRTATVNSSAVGYADMNNNSALDATEPSVTFPANITVISTGHPGDATTIPGFTAQTGSGVMPQFNARGLPCVPVPSPSGACQNFSGTSVVGFVIYVRNQSTMGGVSWGAITITPAGRIRSWLWNGSNYSGL
jgi:prepilin-type N-terminal cleavage/methylation domain-containing protein